MKEYTLGTIIELKPGMKVYTSFPENLRFQNRFLSNKIIEMEITIDKVYRPNFDISLIAIIEKIQNTIHAESGLEISSLAIEKLLNDSIENVNIMPFKLQSGRYMVTEMRMDASDRKKITVSQINNSFHLRLNATTCWFYDNSDIYTELLK